MQFRSALVISLTILAISILFVWEMGHHRKIENLADLDFTSITSDILQGIHDEGFYPPLIDYKDPILLQRKLFLTGDIDARAAETLMEKMLFLDELSPGTPINLYIDSNGGSGGYMLSNFFRLLKTPVNTYALDWCCSSGAEILAAGTGRRYAFTASRIIVHIVPAERDQDDDEKYSRKKMELETTRLFWNQHAKLPKSIVEDDEYKFYNFTAEQALQFGLIDEITTKDPPRAK